MQQTSLLLLIVAGVACLTGWASAALVTLPELVSVAESWRLVSGHFTHADSNHWLMNSVGLLACGLLFERACRGHFTGLLITGMAFVNFWLFNWLSLPAYCGLSGALNAVFVGGCLMRFYAATTWAQHSALRYLWLLLPLLDLAKIAVEYSLGQPLFSDSSWAPAPLAHLAGWLAGACYAVALRVNEMTATAQDKQINRLASGYSVF